MNNIAGFPAGRTVQGDSTIPAHANRPEEQPGSAAVASGLRVEDLPQRQRSVPEAADGPVLSEESEREGRRQSGNVDGIDDDDDDNGDSIVDKSI